jgi:hypothetical protein
VPPSSGRRFWWISLAVIVAAGLLSRLVHTGSPLLDKYLGDALYAAMVYVLLLLTGRFRRVALWSLMLLFAIECFQLTGIPAALFRHDRLLVRLLARLLGTRFSLLDLAAYLAGVFAMAAIAARRPRC